MDEREIPAAVGLCAICRHVRITRTARGTQYYLCQRSLTDKSFPQYPPLPVRFCVGHETEGTQPTESPAKIE